MYPDTDEARLNEKAMLQNAQAYGDAICGALGSANQTKDCDVAQPRACTLSERIAQQLYEARSQSRKMESLTELRYLLDKHPEVARILDLLELARG